MLGNLNAIDRSSRTLIGLGLAVIFFFAVNIFSNSAFKSMQLDLTDEKLFTLSEGTKRVLAMLDDERILESVEALPDEHVALAYDPLHEAAQDAILTWDFDAPTRHVIPLARTPMSEPCVIERRHEMLHTYKLE